METWDFKWEMEINQNAGRIEWRFKGNILNPGDRKYTKMEHLECRALAKLTTKTHENGTDKLQIITSHEDDQCDHCDDRL